MWKGAAEQIGDPKFITLEVKPLGPSAAQEIGTFSLKMKGPTPQEVTGKYLVVWEKVGTDWKLSADGTTGSRHLMLSAFGTQNRRMRRSAQFRA